MPPLVRLELHRYPCARGSPASAASTDSKRFVSHYVVSAVSSAPTRHVNDDISLFRKSRTLRLLALAADSSLNGTIDKSIGASEITSLMAAETIATL